jgi:hypothetical protein
MRYDIAVVRAEGDSSPYVRPAEVKVDGKPWASLVVPRTKGRAAIDVTMTGEGRPMLKRTGALTTEVVAARWEKDSLTLELAGKPSKYAKERLVVVTTGRPVAGVSGAVPVLWSRVKQELTLEFPYSEPRHTVVVEFGPAGR